MRAAVVGGGVIGLASAFALLDVADSVEVLDAGAIGGGASAGNTGWVTPSVSTPLAAPGVLTMGLRSALDPRGALVIRPSLDPAWIAWLWRFARSSRQAVYRRGVAALACVGPPGAQDTSGPRHRAADRSRRSRGR